MKAVLPSFNPCILVAPLDWGLGHATRCIPVIRALATNGAEVVVAGEGAAAALLQTEFPELIHIPMPGYRVHYGKTKLRTLAALLRQVPKLLRAIKDEHVWLQTTIAKYNIDAVISDNRYGLHHPRVHSVFITHQLQVKTGVSATDILFQKLMYRYINRFDACWVPDSEGPQNLAGALSHPKHLPQIPVVYTGTLSRFQFAESVLTHYVLILLSGPEPQRTLLEEKLLQQAKLFKNPILFVRGLPGSVGLPPVPYHITIVNHLPTATLQKAIEGAEFVVSRCGYSTVMDMMGLRKNCIFIPTPAQTEQEYLAQHLMKNAFALCIPQQKFQLENALQLAATFPYQFPHFENGEGLQAAVTNLLAAIRMR
jgi:hypothetical protein